MSLSCHLRVANNAKYIFNDQFSILAQYYMLIIQKKKVELTEILTLEVLFIENPCFHFMAQPHGTFVAETIVDLYDCSLVLLSELAIAFDGQYAEACLAEIAKGCEYFLCFCDGITQPYPSCSFVNIDEISTFVPALLQRHEFSTGEGVVSFVVVQEGRNIEVSWWVSRWRRKLGF
jgi:hypothetical protein